MIRKVGIAASIAGFTGVAIGAFGAHSLKPMLLKWAMYDVWVTGVQYHLVHSLALLAGWAALRNNQTGDNSKQTSALSPLLWAARLWSLGIGMFSGSLYALALGAPKRIAVLTPVGGWFLLGGWAAIGYAALKN